MTNSIRTIAITATALGGALIAGPAFTQGTGTTIARYTLDAGTISGMGALGASGGGAAVAAGSARRWR